MAKPNLRLDHNGTLRAVVAEPEKATGNRGLSRPFDRKPVSKGVCRWEKATRTADSA